MARDKYTIEGNYLSHAHDDLLSGERVVHRYWVPLSGGYVRVDTSRALDKPGTLGRQPTHCSGFTWWAADIWAVKRLVVAARRRERAIFYA